MLIGLFSSDIRETQVGLMNTDASVHRFSSPLGRFIELDDGKILTGKPDQFDGQNPWLSGSDFPQQTNPVTDDSLQKMAPRCVHAVDVSSHLLCQ